MATYIKSDQFAGEFVHSGRCYTERTKLETALGAHNDYVYLSLYAAALGNSVANSTIQDVVEIPEAMTLVAIDCGAVTSVGTAKPTYDIFDESIGTPATMIDAPVEITLAKTSYPGAIASGEEVCAAGRMLGLRCVTDADGTGTTHVCVTLTFKKALTT